MSIESRASKTMVLMKVVTYSILNILKKTWNVLEQDGGFRNVTVDLNFLQH